MVHENDYQIRRKEKHKPAERRFHPVGDLCLNISQIPLSFPNSDQLCRKLPNKNLQTDKIASRTSSQLRRSQPHSRPYFPAERLSLYEARVYWKLPDAPWQFALLLELKLEGNHFLSYNSEQLCSLNTDIWLAAALLTYLFQTISVLGRSIITEKSRNAHRLFALIWLTKHRFLMNYGCLWRGQRGKKCKTQGQLRPPPLQGAEGVEHTAQDGDTELPS